MKLILLSVILVASVVGCSDKDAKAKISELETRLAKIEGKLAYNQTNYLATIAQLGSVMSRMESQMTNELMRRVVGIEGLLISEIKNEVALQMERQITIVRQAPPIAAKRAAPAPRLKNGIPAEAYEAIAAEAAKDWPGDFEMQEYRIKNQVQAYQKLEASR